jgi:hypothetical protein
LVEAITSASARASWMLQTGTPHDHDQAAHAPAVRSVAGGTHHRDGLFDLRRIGRISQALVAERDRNEIPATSLAIAVDRHDRAEART